MYHTLRWWSDFGLCISLLTFGVILLVEATVSNFIHVGGFFIAYAGLNLILLATFTFSSYSLYKSDYCNEKQNRGTYMMFMHGTSKRVVSQSSYWFSYFVVFLITISLLIFFWARYGFNPQNNFTFGGAQNEQWSALVVFGGLSHVWLSKIGFFNLLVWSSVTYGDIAYFKRVERSHV